MALKTYGTMAVDWEQRIDFDRLRRERLDRIKGLLAKSSLGALLCFDMNNVRYITATHIGTWAQDKISRFTLLPQNDEPLLWDFGSAARHHQLNCPWLGERSRPGIPSMRGAMTPEMGREADVAKKIRVELEQRGLLKEPVGVDVVEPPVMFALQREGINVVDGQELMSIAREIKTQDERLLVDSAKKTSRCIVIDEGSFRYGVTGEIASVIAEGAFYDLDGPVRRLGAMHVPIPFSPPLEDSTVPTERDVFEMARKMCNR